MTTSVLFKMGAGYVLNMKLISFNVNGLNAAGKKGVLKFFKQENADMYCLQETKGSDKTVPREYQNLEGYHRYWHMAEKRGYSGVLTFSKEKALSVTHGVGYPETDREGRVLTLEYEKFFLINAYFVNAQAGLKRLEVKQKFNQAIMKHCEKLRKKKPVVICGDFNVAHEEIDLARPKTNHKSAGFSDEERQDFTSFLELGYIDTFREFEKESGHYSWWTMRVKTARGNNVGWRLDYFLISEELKPNLKNSEILQEILGSDHCPVRLELEI